MQLKVGIAGFGVVGRRRKEYIDSNPDLCCVAVCDRNYIKERPQDNSINYYSNYIDLLKEDLDAVFVCMSNDMAAEVTIAALRNNMNVFCEKPPGRNVEEVEEVIKNKQKRSHLKLMYGFNHRYHESVVDALEIMNSGELGKIINIRAVYGKAKLITFNQAVWRTDRSLAGGGVLLDQGIHILDLMMLFGGEFTEVHSFVSNRHWQYEVEDNAYAIMKSPQGTIAMLHSSATQWRHRFSLEINFEKGSLNLGGILSGTKSYGAETLTVVYAHPDNDSGDPKEVLTKYNNDPSWETEIKLFTESVLNNTEISSGSASDALKAMKLVYSIYYNDKEWKNKYNIKNPN